MTKPSQPGLLRRVARALGPGLMTGAADDDPSGIVTYSMAGAQHGMALLWLAWDHLAADGGGADDVRPSRHGDR